MRFLGYIVFHQGIQMKKEQIKVIRYWSEPQSVHDIQIFLEFANFYQQFIQEFSRLATLFTFMLTTTSVTTLSVEVGDENPEQAGKEIQIKD